MTIMIRMMGDILPPPRPPRLVGPEEELGSPPDGGKFEPPDEPHDPPDEPDEPDDPPERGGSWERRRWGASARRREPESFVVDRLRVVRTVGLFDCLAMTWFPYLLATMKRCAILVNS
jgi:hypothetical protein